MIRIKLILVALILPGLLIAAEGNLENDARMLINLMDYIAKDYQMAVEDGEVISAFEFEEMNEFAATASDYANKLAQHGAVDSTSEIWTGIRALQALIEQKAGRTEVANAADRVKAQLIGLNIVSLQPATLPNLEAGKALYADLCATCHGINGDGDGPAGNGLNPPPTVFTDREIMSGVAPFQAYNTIRLGIPGTGMRAFNELSDSEVWNLSFYILSLQHDATSIDATLNIPIEDLAALSDEELTAEYPNVNLSAQRNISFEVEASTEPTQSETDIARSLLNEASVAYGNGQKDQALTAALNAYLLGVEPIEPQILASDNALFERLETSMMGVRSLIKSGAAEDEIAAAIAEANLALDEADALLGQGTPTIGTTAFIAASILVREGLEAFLIILAILGILKSMNAPRAIRWIHGGWIAAVFAGLIGWLFADTLMMWSAASRELMEGLIALIAVAFLLYLGFWLHGKTEAAKWKAFVETRIKNLISQNNMIGLGVFSFVVVFREAFESVLFLSSLTANGATESKIGVALGFIGAAILIFCFAWAMLKWFKRMPISQVFLYSSLLILALAFVLTGKGIHAIQEGGFLDIHSFPVNLRIGLLGIYPTYESILAQFLILLIIAGLWKLSGQKSVSVEK